jgi:hypothetical protein
MGTLVSGKVTSNTEKFLSSYRLGVDFGDKAHGVAVVRNNEVIVSATLLDEAVSDLKKRRQSRRGRRTRESRRQRLARLRQWCLRNHLPDPDPYVNPEINSVVWPPNRGGKPESVLKSLTKQQRSFCHSALRDDTHWQLFLDLPPEAKNQCALINPFIARRLAREDRAKPLVFVRALWHLFEHRGFDWYARIRGEQDEEDFLQKKDALIRHLKTLVLPTEDDSQKMRGQIQERDKERKEKSGKAKPWIEDPEIKKELAEARKRGEHFPTQRRLNPPRHYVESELKECLRSLPMDKLGEEFGRKKDQPPLSGEQKRGLAFGGLKKLLNWNRREPRFDNRQLRGCTWCAMRGIHRNTPRKKNVLPWLIEASINDIKVAAGEAAKTAEAEAKKQKRVSRRQRMALTEATRWLEPEERKKLKGLVFDAALSRDDLKSKLDEFFRPYALLPKRTFAEEGQTTKKKLTLTDPYQYHREELLNLADALHHRRRMGGRIRFCESCFKVYAKMPPDQRQSPVGEADVVLSQRMLKARCDRLVAWVKQNLTRFHIEYIRIEAVLPRPEEKSRLKAQAAQAEPDQLPKEKLKFRLMEEVGALCNACKKPYRKWKRQGPESNRDKEFCQCQKPNLKGRCAYCGGDFSPDELQIEHIYPRNPIDTSGGIGPDAQINKTVACEACNQSEKKNRLPFDYFQHAIGDDAWTKWKERVKGYRWPDAKRKVALLEKYELPKELGDVALARTGLVHRYLRQELSASFFPDEAKCLKDNKASQQAKIEAKSFLDQHLSTPAGWMTSQCRLDWEHLEEDGQVVPLVPRKSPLLTSQEREKRRELSLAKARDDRHKQGIIDGNKKRAWVEEQLRKVERLAVCDRTNLNHHWIDAAVLASLPPQANQPVEMGGIWVRRGGEVRASKQFAPRAAEFLDRWGDGSLIFELGRRMPRFRARQQEESLYGLRGKGIAIIKEKATFKPKRIPAELHEAAQSLPLDIFEYADGRLSIRRISGLTSDGAETAIEAISNQDLRKTAAALLEENYERRKLSIYEPVGNLKVKDKALIVSDYWRDVFGKLCEQEYDFPKKRSDEAEDGKDTKAKTERRRPKDDDVFPLAAWTKWAERENEERHRQGKEDDVSVPKHLRIYFEKLTPNERVTFPGGGKAAPSKRGIPKPSRITRMTPVGSHAVIDLDSGDLTVVLNPWKRHVEKTDAAKVRGARLYKGDCIWLSNGKTGTGWYRIIEMSPAKQRLSGKTKEPSLKTVPAWLDVNQLVQEARDKEPNAEKRKKITSAKWEVLLSASALKDLSTKNELRIKHKFEDLPGLFDER